MPIQTHPNVSKQDRNNVKKLVIVPALAERDLYLYMIGFVWIFRQSLDRFGWVWMGIWGLYWIVMLFISLMIWNLSWFVYASNHPHDSFCHTIVFVAIISDTLLSPFSPSHCCDLWCHYFYHSCCLSSYNSVVTLAVPLLSTTLLPLPVLGEGI